MEPKVEEHKVSALEDNIKKKGETSYYYAHKGKFENHETDPNAKTITGPGIITGGNPILLQSEQKKVEVIKEAKNIDNYVFYDDDKIAVVKIILPQNAKEIPEECLEPKFEKRAFHLRINVPNEEPYFFSVNKLYEKIIPEKSTCKIVNTKNGRTIKICFAKEDEDDEWTKLTP